MDGTAVNFLKLIFPYEAGTWDPYYTPGVDIFDHDFLQSKQIHINIYLMRGQTLFWVHQKLVIDLLKHSYFLTNYIKLQIFASCNNLWIGQGSEFAKFWPKAFIDNIKIDHALTFGMPKKVASLLKLCKDWVSLCRIIRIKSFPPCWSGQKEDICPSFK